MQINKLWNSWYRRRALLVKRTVTLTLPEEGSELVWRGPFEGCPHHGEHSAETRHVVVQTSHDSDQVWNAFTPCTDHAAAYEGVENFYVMEIKQ